MSNLRFENRVVIITGAGGGLGRAHALEFAKRGAKVVVNDLGGDTKGDSAGNARAADLVVSEIKKAGGVAVANYDSVLEGEKIVKTAIDSFGRVDIIINNAGILRDVSFHRMTQRDWDLIFDVHCKGAYAVTRAAWPYMRDQGYGRVINTTSAAGLYGNFGQCNYSAAKMALVGFTTALAKEGASKNVFANAIAPLAGSRMTATVMPPELLEKLKPEYVSPLVAYLCHDSCKENGQVFEVGAGWVAKVRLQRTAGAFMPLDNVTAERVASSIEKIGTFDAHADYPADTQNTMGPVMANLGNMSAEMAAYQPNSKAAVKGAAAPAAPAAATAGASDGSSSVRVAGFKTSAVMENLVGVLAKRGEQLRNEVGGTFRFDVSGANGKTQSWRVAVPKTGAVGVTLSTTNEAADVVLSGSDDILTGVMTGTEKPQAAFMSGKIKFKGAMPLVMKLGKLSGEAKL